MCFDEGCYHAYNDVITTTTKITITIITTTGKPLRRLQSWFTLGKCYYYCFICVIVVFIITTIATNQPSTIYNNNKKQ